MERANHINIAMTDSIDINGSAGSKVSAAADRSGQPLGSTVSFHNIQYKVQLRSGIFGKENSSGKEILTDLKLVKCFCLIKNFGLLVDCGLFSLFLHFPMVLNAFDISHEKKTNNFHTSFCAFSCLGVN